MLMRNLGVKLSSAIGTAFSAKADARFTAFSKNRRANRTEAWRRKISNSVWLPMLVATILAIPAPGIAAQNNAQQPAGNVFSWGYNASGQLGNGTTADSGTPVLVSGLGDVVAIAGGSDHSMALKSDGTVWTW